MVLLKDGGQEDRNPLFALIVGKVIVIWGLGGGNYGYDGVVVKNVGINSVFSWRTEMLTERFAPEKKEYQSFWSGRNGVTLLPGQLAFQLA